MKTEDQKHRRFDHKILEAIDNGAHARRDILAECGGYDPNVERRVVRRMKRLQERGLIFYDRRRRGWYLRSVAAPYLAYGW